MAARVWLQVGAQGSGIVSSLVQHRPTVIRTDREHTSSEAERNAGDGLLWRVSNAADIRAADRIQTRCGSPSRSLTTFSNPVRSSSQATPWIGTRAFGEIAVANALRSAVEA